VSRNVPYATNAQIFNVSTDDGAQRIQVCVRDIVRRASIDAALASDILTATLIAAVAEDPDSTIFMLIWRPAYGGSAYFYRIAKVVRKCIKGVNNLSPASMNLLRKGYDAYRDLSDEQRKQMLDQICNDATNYISVVNGILETEEEKPTPVLKQRVAASALVVLSMIGIVFLRNWWIILWVTFAFIATAIWRAKFTHRITLLRSADEVFDIIRRRAGAKVRALDIARIFIHEVSFEELGLKSFMREPLLEIRSADMEYIAIDGSVEGTVGGRSAMSYFTLTLSLYEDCDLDRQRHAFHSELYRHLNASSKELAEKLRILD
jgi:hypothetical protein